MNQPPCWLRKTSTVRGRTRPALAPLALALLLAACAPSSPGSRAGREAGGVPAGGLDQVQPRAPGRTLVMAVRVEPLALGFKLLAGSNNARSARRLVNAAVVVTDDQGVGHPYLVSALPTLNTDSWRVLSDGRMETTFAVRPNLAWHDGTPLVADDFAFAYRVMTATETAPLWQANPQNMMEEVLAPDPRILVIRWRETYPGAAELKENDFQPLPRHILEAQFQRDRGDAFAAHPHWTTEYVGAGPFRLDRWEPGGFMEMSAFDGHALGRPKIDRVRLQWISDPNTGLANILSGDVHIAVNDSMQFQQGAILERQWAATGGGTVLRSAREARFVQVQFRPEVQIQKAFFDLRVRKALAHAIDKQAPVEGLLDGQSIIADTFPPPQVSYYQALLASIPRYQHDPRLADQYMAEAGWIRGPSGLYVGAAGERFVADFRAFGGGQEETEQAILVDGLRRNAWDLTSTVVPAISTGDLQMRATFASLTANVTQLSERVILNKLQGYNIPYAENRWAGFNRGAWNNPEFDRAERLFNTTLDRRERDQLMIQMMRIVNEDVGVIPLFYNPDTVPHVAALRGPTVSSPDTMREWNIHQWEWVR